MVLTLINKVPPQSLILSPMAGFSDLPFRLIAREMGSALSISEFAPAISIPHRTMEETRRLKFNTTERPMIHQIFGNDTQHFVRAVEHIAGEKMQPDGIDVNMGCSVKKVAHKGSGAGLLKDLDQAGKIVNALVRLNLFPVSAKIRLGWDTDSRNYIDTARMLESEGAWAVFVHGRTRRQGYSGEADWDAIGEVATAVDIPVFGNGDIQNYEQAMGRIKNYGVYGVLIGRAARGNPWIFSGEGKEDLSYNERLPLILRHLELMQEFYGSEEAAKLFRKHLALYLGDLEIFHEHKNALYSAQTTPELSQTLTRTTKAFSQKLSIN